MKTIITPQINERIEMFVATCDTIAAPLIDVLCACAYVVEQNDSIAAHEIACTRFDVDEMSLLALIDEYTYVIIAILRNAKMCPCLHCVHVACTLFACVATSHHHDVHVRQRVTYNAN